MMSNNLKNVFLYLSSIFLAFELPQIVYAQPNNFKELISIVTDIIALLVPLVAGLAILYFFWGLAKYIFAQGNEESKIEGKNIMFWGLVGLFFMLSIYGIVSFFGSILPQFPVGR